MIRRVEDKDGSLFVSFCSFQTVFAYPVHTSVRVRGIAEWSRSMYLLSKLWSSLKETHRRLQDSNDTLANLSVSVLRLEECFTFTSCHIPEASNVANLILFLWPLYVMLLWTWPPAARSNIMLHALTLEKLDVLIISQIFILILKVSFFIGTVLRQPSC